MLHGNSWQDKYLNTEGKATMMGARNMPLEPLKELKPGTYWSESLQKEQL